jgi:hypothetical protein
MLTKLEKSEKSPYDNFFVFLPINLGIFFCFHYMETKTDISSKINILKKNKYR